MKRVRDYIDKDKMNVAEGDMMLTFKEGKGDEAVEKLEEIEGKDGSLKGCDYVIESVEADVDDPSQAYVKIKVGTPKVETLIKNVLKANKVLGDVSDIDADFGKGEAKAEPKAKKAGKKTEQKAEGGEQKAEQPAAKKSFKEMAWEKKNAKKTDSVNKNNVDMKRVRDEYNSEAFDRADKAIDDFIESRIEKYGNNYTLRDLDDEDLDELDRLTEKAHRIVKGDEVPYESYREYLSKTSDSRKIKDAEGIKQPKQNETIDFNKDGLNFSIENVPLNGYNGYFILSSEDGKISGYRSKYGDFYGGYKTPDDAFEKIVAKVNEHVNLSKSVSDSKKISDAEEKPLNGMLMIAFNDGTEEDMIAEVKKHENEQNDSNGIQYEIYSVDEQDGVAMVDLCAVGVKDANEFIKALLKAWNVLDNVADVDFDVQTEEEYQEEQGEEVSDSKKIKDDGEPSPYNYKSIAEHLEFVALKGNTHRMTAQFEMDALEDTGYVLADYGVLPNGNAGYCYIDSADKNFNYDNPDSECIYFECENKEPYFIVDVDYKNRLAQFGNVSDSRKVKDARYEYDDFGEYREVGDYDDLGEDDMMPYQVFEGNELVKGFYDEDEAVDFAIGYSSKHNSDYHIEVIYVNDLGTHEDVIWSSVWEDEEFLD